MSWIFVALLLAIFLLGGLAALVYVMIQAIAKRRHGLILAGLAPLCFVAALMGYKGIRAWNSGGVHWGPPEIHHHIGQVEANARNHAANAELQAEQLRQMAIETRLDEANKSMHQLYDELSRPRIVLDAGNGHDTVIEKMDVSNDREIAAKPADLEASATASQETIDSLSGKIARLERMVEQVSTAADRVSTAGTFIGKAIIVLGDSIKSSKSTEAETQSHQAQAIAEPPVPPLAVQWASNAAAAAETNKSSDEGVKDASPIAIGDSEGKTDPSAPSWTRGGRKRYGNVWKSVVVTEPFVTREECNREADRQLMLATVEHLATITGIDLRDPNGAETSQYEDPIRGIDNRVQALRRMSIGLDFVRREIVKDEYEETVQMSFGPMKRLYTLVEFSPSVDAELRSRWNEYRRAERFATVGLGAGSVLGLLGLAFGLLKADTLTKGYYTKRLFLGVPAAIIGGVFAYLAWFEMIF